METNLPAELTAVSKALQKANITDVIIANAAEECAALVIVDHNDKKGYEAVRSKRMQLVRMRVEAVKICKDLRADFIRQRDLVIQGEKMVVGQIEALENGLEEKEATFKKHWEAVEAEKKRVAEAEQKAKENAERDRINEIYKRLHAVNVYPTANEVADMTPEEVDEREEAGRKKMAWIAEETAKEDAARKAAEEKLRIEREEHEAKVREDNERARIESERQKEAARIEADRLNAEWKKRNDEMIEEGRKKKQAEQELAEIQAEAARVEAERLAEERAKLEKERAELVEQQKIQREKEIEAHRLAEVERVSSMQANDALTEALLGCVTAIRDMAVTQAVTEQCYNAMVFANTVLDAHTNET